MSVAIELLVSSGVEFGLLAAIVGLYCADLLGDPVESVFEGGLPCEVVQVLSRPPVLDRRVEVIEDEEQKLEACYHTET